MNQSDLTIHYLIREPGHKLISINRISTETATSLNQLSMMKRMRTKWIAEDAINFDIDTSAFPPSSVKQTHNKAGLLRTSCTQDQVDRARSVLPRGDR